jgi:hypothetical protein
VGGRADVAQYHERSMGFEQKGCVTEATVLQHALAVWMPTSLMAKILEMRSQIYKVFALILAPLSGPQTPTPCVYSKVMSSLSDECEGINCFIHVDNLDLLHR